MLAVKKNTSRALVVSFVLALTFSSCRGKPNKPSANKKNLPFLFVNTTHPQRKKARETIQIQGEVKAERTSNVGAEVAGKIIKVFVKEGDHVSSGQVLFLIDGTNLRFQLKAIRQKIKQARAHLELLKKGAREEELRQARERVKKAQAGYELARKNEERSRKLFAEGAISLSELDAAQAEAEQALAQFNEAKEALELLKKGAREEEIKAQEAQLKQAQIEEKQLLDQIKKTSVKTPFSGIVEKILAQEGEVVSPGIPLLRLLGEPFFFEGEVPEKYRKEITTGKVILLRKDGVEKALRINRVMPMVSPQSRTFAIRANVPAGSFAPGSFFTARIVLSEAELLILPEKSIKQEDESFYLFTVENGKAHKRKVEGKWVEEGFAVRSGVTEKDEVITTLSSYLMEGVAVKVIR